MKKLRNPMGIVSCLFISALSVMPSITVASTDFPHTQPGRVEGKIALITGAARGIGAETAAYSLKRGPQLS